MEEVGCLTTCRLVSTRTTGVAMMIARTKECSSASPEARVRRYWTLTSVKKICRGVPKTVEIKAFPPEEFLDNYSHV